MSQRNINTGLNTYTKSSYINDWNSFKTRFGFFKSPSVIEIIDKISI